MIGNSLPEGRKVVQDEHVLIRSSAAKLSSSPLFVP